jgi:hypothetical protein
VLADKGEDTDAMVPPMERSRTGDPAPGQAPSVTALPQNTLPAAPPDGAVLFPTQTFSPVRDPLREEQK